MFFLSFKASLTCSFVKQSLPLFRPEMRVLVGQDELDRVEEVGLARAVTTDDHIVTWRELYQHYENGCQNFSVCLEFLMTSLLF